MAEQCRWTVTDADGNKYDVRRSKLVAADGREWELGPARGRKRGALSWPRAERMLRRGTAALVLDVPGMGDVRLSPEGGGGMLVGGMLVPDRKVDGYRWGCPDGAAVRGVSADGSVVWRDPTAAERTAIADSLLVSTLARVNSASSESKRHARAVAGSAAERLLGGSNILRPSLPVSGNKIVETLTAARIATSGDGDETEVLFGLELAVRSALAAGLAFGPEVAEAVATHHPYASTREALMLAVGVAEDRRHPRFSPKEPFWEMWRIGVGREDLAAAAASREKLMASGALRDTAVGGEEGLYGGTVRDALALSRVESRAGYLLGSSEYENMPFLPELVRAAAGYADDPARFEDALYRAESTHPGAALWAAAHSGDQSLQSAAVLSLATSADIQYVRAVAAEAGGDSLLSELSKEAAARLADEPSVSVESAREERGRLNELLISYPGLRASKPFLRSVFDTCQDAGETSDAVRTAEIMFPGRDDVPSWLLDHELMKRVQEASRPENRRAASAYDDYYAGYEPLPAEVVKSTLPTKVRIMSDMASGLQLLDAGADKFMAADAKSYDTYQGGLMNYYVHLAIDDLTNAPGGREMVEGMSRAILAAVRPEATDYWSRHRESVFGGSQAIADMRAELSSSEVAESKKLEWDLEGLLRLRNMSLSKERGRIFSAATGPLPDQWAREDNLALGARARQTEQLVARVMDRAELDLAAVRAEAEGRYALLRASADARRDARGSAEARRRAGMSA